MFELHKICLFSGFYGYLQHMSEQSLIFLFSMCVLKCDQKPLTVTKNLSLSNECWKSSKNLASLGKLNSLLKVTHFVECCVTDNRIVKCEYTFCCRSVLKMTNIY